MNNSVHLAPRAKKLVSSLLVGVLLFTLAVKIPTAQAVSDGTVAPSTQKMFLKIDGINGDSKEQGHAGAFDVSSFKWESTATSVGGKGGLGNGKVSFGDIELDLTASWVSPDLLNLMATGKHIKSGTLEIEYPTGPVITIRLTDVQVTKYALSGSNLDEKSTEHLALSFNKLVFEFDHPNGLQGVTSISK